MNKSATIEATGVEETNLKAAIDEYLAQIEQLREQMKRDQAEIVSSRARTDAMLAQLQSR